MENLQIVRASVALNPFGKWVLEGGGRKSEQNAEHQMLLLFPAYVLHHHSLRLIHSGWSFRRAMASLLHSGPATWAMRKQATAIPLRVSSAQSVASVQTCNSFSTLCPQTRLSVSHSHPQISLSSTFKTSLPTCQSRTFLTQLRRQAQALKEQSPSAHATPVNPSKNPSPPLKLDNLPYFVRRSASNKLPVYTDTKAGGTKKLTKIQKTEGDLDQLRNDLACALGVVDGHKPNPDVAINRLTGHIVVKGWRKPEILKFLEERKF
ncbi:hypothetical protein N7522_001029 [Penicillium canescens]|nr:uncharacterized protein N7446_008125 [Penicillium canescens]KAJ6018962.1 hypothetical protein N7522_001029 [Penicillium canescens]KAJ6033584.1 hypothetical protein N7444_011355 [Penicillium canescens]KAJ6058542.1 hypothetical protein N7446_008125 [Penicillium canescens]